MMSTTSQPQLEASAHVLDALAQASRHVRQDVGADVRMMVPEDVLRRARGDECFEQEAHAPVLDPGVELAVAVGTGAAFAEEVVALGRQLARRMEAFDVVATRSTSKPRSMTSGSCPCRANR